MEKDIDYDLPPIDLNKPKEEVCRPVEQIRFITLDSVTSYQEFLGKWTKANQEQADGRMVRNKKPFIAGK